MFAAIFNLRAEPVDAQQVLGGPGSPSGAPTGQMDCETLGRAVFMCSNANAPDVAGEEYAIHALGGRYWIAGRVRLDARPELRARLDATGSTSAAIPDIVLCLRAYAKWGERFVDFLAGDFSFVLWDDERQSLIAVRDQFGMRPLFHARTANAWFISDSLDWIAARTSIGRDLDDYWIADFLTLGICREFERTVYRDIQRLPPAHLIRLDDSGAAIRRYWRLDIGDPIQFADPRAYPERFRELLSQAVADRLPAGRIGISMSGGLDSTALAASAVGVTGDTSRVVAECEHYRELMHIGEDHFASLAARRLGIDLQINVVDDLCYDPHWRSRDMRPAEPAATMLNLHNHHRMEAGRASRATVWFDGEGPDNALVFERNSYLKWLVKQRSWTRLASALVQYARVKGVAGWAQSFRRHAGQSPESQPYNPVPGWLNRDFVDRVRLKERAASLDAGGDRSHPWHPVAVASFTSPIWQCDFDNANFLETRTSAVWRYPYLDLRLIEFMLSVPPIPWGWKKHLMRDAMRDRLPPEVLERPKTPLPCYPDAAVIRKRGLPTLSGGKQLDDYVDVQHLPTIEATDGELYFGMGAHVLDRWLTSGFAASKPR